MKNVSLSEKERRVDSQNKTKSVKKKKKGQ
jgi:hypothetical protein